MFKRDLLKIKHQAFSGLYVVEFCDYVRIGVTDNLQRKFKDNYSDPRDPVLTGYLLNCSFPDVVLKKVREELSKFAIRGDPNEFYGIEMYRVLRCIEFYKRIGPFVGENDNMRFKVKYNTFFTRFT